MQRTLGGGTVTSEVTKMSLNELKFFYKNPRVYSTVHSTFGSEPTQDEIFRVMKLQQHVLDLKKQIKVAIDALKDQRVEEIGQPHPLWQRKNSASLYHRADEHDSFWH